MQYPVPPETALPSFTVYTGVAGAVGTSRKQR